MLDARQYTIPKEDALGAVRSGANPTLTARDKHLRECFVVAKEGANLNDIENKKSIHQTKNRLNKSIIPIYNYFKYYFSTEYQCINYCVKKSSF